MSTVRVPSCNFPWAQLTVGCMDCKVKRANFGMPDDRLRRWCGTCARAHDGAIDVVNKRCEDCQKKRPNFGMPGERKARWCHGCSQKHTGAENVVSKRCEDCKNKQPSYGMSHDNKQRWCQPCSQKHVGSVNLVGKKKGGAQGGTKATVISSLAGHQINQIRHQVAPHAPLGPVAVIAEASGSYAQQSYHQPVPPPIPPNAQQNGQLVGWQTNPTPMSNTQILPGGVKRPHDLSAPVPLENPPAKRQHQIITAACSLGAPLPPSLAPPMPGGLPPPMHAPQPIAVSAVHAYPGIPMSTMGNFGTASGISPPAPPMPLSSPLPLPPGSYEYHLPTSGISAHHSYPATALPPGMAGSYSTVPTIQSAAAPGMTHSYSDLQMQPPPVFNSAVQLPATGNRLGVAHSPIGIPQVREAVATHVQQALSSSVLPPSITEAVPASSMPGGGGANMPDALPVHPPMGAMGAMGGGGLQPPPSLGLQPPPSLQMMGSGSGNWNR